MFYEKLLVRLRRERFRPAALAVYFRGTFTRVREGLEHNPEFVRSLLVATVVLFGIVLSLSVWLAIAISRGTGTRFLEVSAVWLAFVFLWPFVHTSLSRDADDVPTARVTLPNFFSLLRLSLVPGLFLLIVEKHTAYAIALFAAGAVSDVVDGFIARTFSQQTRMGLVLDPVVDVVFNASTIWALVISWKLSVVIGLLITIRYMLLLGGGAYIYVFHGPVRIRPTVFGRLTAVFLSVMILVFMYLYQYGAPLLRERLSDLMETGLSILLIGTILHVLTMGIYNLRLYPKIVSSEEKRSDVERKTRTGA